LKHVRVIIVACRGITKTSKKFLPTLIADTAAAFFSPFMLALQQQQHFLLLLRSFSVAMQFQLN
jgi:hypothetical protein